jgi:hypothetical protein
MIEDPSLINHLKIKAALSPTKEKLLAMRRKDFRRPQTADRKQGSIGGWTGLNKEQSRNES